MAMIIAKLLAPITFSIFCLVFILPPMHIQFGRDGIVCLFSVVSRICIRFTCNHVQRYGNIAMLPYNH